jgi:hypothetical protein
MANGTMTDGQEEWGICWSSAIVPLAMLDSEMGRESQWNRELD